MKKALILSIFLILTIISTANALTDCGTITTNEVLENDIYAGSLEDPCIEFGADNITLNCQGYKIIGTGAIYGIFAENKNTLIIENCEIEDFIVDVELQNTTDSRIEGNIFNKEIKINYGSNNIIIQMNKFYNKLRIEGPSNIINNNTFYQNEYDSSLTISDPYNSITNNLFSGNGIGLAIANLEEASYNTISYNTILNYINAIWLGAIGSASEYNEVSYNTLIDNEIAIRIYGGDLNNIHNNTINITGGLDGPESSNWGFDLANSRNNKIYNNELTLENNYFDIDQNLYKFKGEINNYDFVISPNCQGDCIYPNETETLDNQGIWFGGADTKDPFDLGKNSLDAWNSITHEKAIGGNLMYHPKSSNNDYVYWLVHSTDNIMNVKVWKFAHQYSSLMSNQVKIVIKHADGLTTKYIDQSSQGDEWIDLGNYRFDDSFRQGVGIFTSNRGIVAADAFQIESIQ